MLLLKVTEFVYALLSPLKSHQRQHNKDKPFKCSNCYRAYSDSASLQIHLSAHAIKNAKAYCCSMCGRAYTSVSSRPKRNFKIWPHCSGDELKCCFSFPGDVPYEAHVKTHNGGACGVPSLPSAQDRVSHHPYTHLPHLSSTPVSCPPIRGVSCDICALLTDSEPTDGFQKCARLYKYLVKRCSLDERILLSFLADQIVLSGTSKDDFSALSGLEMTGRKMSFSVWLHRKKKLLWAATWKIF